jgi:hypothetical protein
METRRLHPAPPDYGVVETCQDQQRACFLVYYEGHEIGRFATLGQAQRAIEDHRGRAAEPPGEEPPPIPHGNA